MPSARLLLAACVCLTMAHAALADQAVPADVEGRLADMEARLNVDRQVQPAAYLRNPAEPRPTYDAQAGVPLPPPAYQPAPPAAYDEGPVMVCPCPPRPACRTGRWLLGFDLIPTQFLLTDAAFGHWPDDSGMAARLTFGYEGASGLGIRGRLWGFGEDVSPPATDLTVAASTFNIEVFKRIQPCEGELVLGMGTVGNVLEFELPANTRSRFEGGGLSVFADGYYPLVHFEKSDLGVVGRGRMSLVEGRWTDTTGLIVAPTQHDMLNIYEVAFGIEFRRRFGPLEDKYWYIGLTEEIQRWDSPWMDHYLASTAGFDGLNVNFGLAW
jgi:hypothetical protein